MPVSKGSRSRRTRVAMTTSSSEALPARSPIPFTVHSSCRTPASTAASEFATREPQVVVAVRAEDHAVGVAHPRHHRAEERRDLARDRVADGIGQVEWWSPPAAMAVSTTRHRKSMSLRMASSAENSTSSV